MFKIAAAPKFTRDVTVKVPAGEGYEEQTFKADFTVLDDEASSVFDVNTLDGMRDFCDAIWLKAFDLADEDGKPVAFTAAVKEQLLALPYVRIALIRTYRNTVIGALAGN